MKLNKELLEKAKAAKSAEELAEMAKAEGVEMTAEEAEKAFADLHKTGELSDEELDNVSGGCSDGNPSDAGAADSREAVVFLYEVGQQVEMIIGKCGQTKTVTILDRFIYESPDSGKFYPEYKVKYEIAGGNEWVCFQNKIQIP